ncbi:MAG TPA: transcription antitermination factor NusB [Alphaproteobacteria bacterium]|jgi:N utilization substance protein B
MNQRGAAREPHRSPKAQRRGAARLAAVQALYQIELTGASPDRVLREFVAHRIGAAPRPAGEEAAPDEAIGETDRELFAAIVHGACERRQELDEMVASALAPGWSLERMDRVLRALLRAGAYELFARPETPARVVIAEYIAVANAFYEGREPGFVNGVLDKLARVLRPDEMAGAGPPEPLPDQPPKGN